VVVLGMVAAALAAFVVSSVYYVLVTPLERRALGAAALERGRPGPAKVLTELVRTVVTAAVFAWIADRTGDLDVGSGVPLALALWVGFPVVLLTGSVTWEKVPPVTAAVHAGDWLLKLLLVAVVLGLLH
jgi:glycerol uptake facilitator-like aquaporin